MRVLFDKNVPFGLARHLQRHSVLKAAQLGWGALSNGRLLAAAEQAGFEVLVTADKSIRYQQNIESRRIALVVLGSPSWPLLQQHIPEIQGAIDAAVAGSYFEVEIIPPPKAPNLQQ
ncbi:hypothetical protein F183_A32490 [Bryobacterales bacterium F-183]|nr:hypothetical protein F183_A32490 [Bryobacterales bacterium F-183]